MNVFSPIRQQNLNIQLHKSEFLRKGTQFLEHIFSSEEIKPNPHKIILNFPVKKIRTY